MPRRYTAAELNQRFRDNVPGLLGMETLSVEPELVTGRVPIRPALIAGTGFLWAPVIVLLADALCAWGTGLNMADEASFTTVEQKTNFLGSLRSGAIFGRATPAHVGRSTQVWDATVTDEASGKTLALYRCTQMILYPRAQ